jgi:alkanesulfonate monooxygenase SsuD/methylene tetrahydromethanopterin reductase-like flavin-dependent oxidoreductase (luciferase family)
VLLAAVAERTSRIALATGVITLPLDDPLRVAEDATVLDQLSGGRVQLGLATGGTPSSFAAFGRESDRRREIFAEHFEVLLDALGGRGIRGTDSASTLRRRPVVAHLAGDVLRRRRTPRRRAR